MEDQNTTGAAVSQGAETPDLELRSASDVRDRMRALVDGAGDGLLPDELIKRYEGLEAHLAKVNVSASLRSRHAAYDQAHVPAATAARFDAGFHASGAAAAAEDGSAGFRAYLRSGDPNQDLVLGGGLETRAQSETIGSAGGYLVPDGFRGKIVERMVAFGGLEAQAEIVSTSTGQPLPWPTLDDTANSGEIVNEGAQPAGGADLTFGTNTLGAYSFASSGPSGEPLLISWELAMDADYDIEAKVANALGVRIGRKKASLWVNGTGINQPQGILIGGATPSDEIISNTAGISYAELVAATHAVDVAYREMGNCRWAFSDGVASLIEQLVDLNGRPLLHLATESIGGAPVKTLLGYPVTIDNAMPATWGDQARTLVFGDIREGYVVRNVKEISLVVFKELYARSRQFGYMAWARGDGRVQNSSAFTIVAGQNV